VERQPEVLVDVAARLLEVDPERCGVGPPAACPIEWRRSCTS
jgi:hypothetical protein